MGLLPLCCFTSKDIWEAQWILQTPLAGMVYTMATFSQTSGSSFICAPSSKPFSWAYPLPQDEHLTLQFIGRCPWVSRGTWISGWYGPTGFARLLVWIAQETGRQWGQWEHLRTTTQKHNCSSGQSSSISGGIWGLQATGVWLILGWFMRKRWRQRTNCWLPEKARLFLKMWLFPVLTSPDQHNPSEIF